MGSNIKDNQKDVVMCPACDNTFNYNEIPESGMGYVKCPSCNEPVTQGDVMGGNPVDEVEKKTVTQYDLSKSGDVEQLNKDIRTKRPDPSKFKIDSGSAQIEEGLFNKQDILDLFEGKIHLSETEIENILSQTEVPVMSKFDILESIQNIISEADMNDDVRRKFESGENDYVEHLSAETVRRMSDEVFSDIQRNIREKTGKQNPTTNDVMNFYYSSLMNAFQIEERLGKTNLQNKAIDLIKKQFNIPEGVIDFEAILTGQQPVEMGNIQFRKGTKPKPENKNDEELNQELTRRRLTNAMMHGSARKAQNLHHLADEIRETNPELARAYTNIMAVNDFNYWSLSDEQIKLEGESGVHAGNVRVELPRNPGDKPKIIAQGVVFPILLHELAKGVMELMSLWSLPKDKETREYVLDKTDNLEMETNDIRLGPKIWEKFIEQIPVNNQQIISMTYNKLQSLPTKDFNETIKGLLNNEEEARNTIKSLVDESIEELRGEEYEEAIKSDDTEDYGEDDSLTNDDLDFDKDDYSKLSKSQIQDLIDKALDDGDFDTVEKLSKYL
jgi:hypothetical protein